MKKMESSRVDVQKIKEFMAAKKLSQMAFSEQCGMSVGTMRKILSGNSTYKLEHILDIATVMKVQIKELLKKIDDK